MRLRTPVPSFMPPLAALRFMLLAVLLAHIAADSPEKQLIEWVRAAGGQVNVDIAAPQGLRGTYASEDITKGSYLAVIPERLVYVARKQATFNAEAAAVKLLHDMHDTSSTWGPYFAALPEEGLLSKYTFPESYARMLQSGVEESDLVYSQQRLEQYWTAEEDELSGYGVTLSDLVHAAALVDTRALSTPLGEASLVPVVDMANHQTLCPNMLHLGACHFDEQQQCLFWQAGRDYKAGEEVCMSYGGMFNDRSLLQYGFLIEDPDPPHVFGADRHDYDVGDPWSNQHFMEELPAPFDAESVEEYLQEADRQRSMLFYLKRADKEAGAEPTDPADPGGKIKALVLRWRELRKAALAAEVSRLRGVLEAVGEQLLSEAEYEAQLQQRLDDERDMLLDVGTLGERYAHPDDDGDEDGAADGEEGVVGEDEDAEDELFIPGQETEPEPDTRDEL